MSAWEEGFVSATWAQISSCKFCLDHFISNPSYFRKFFGLFHASNVWYDQYFFKIYFEILKYPKQCTTISTVLLRACTWSLFSIRWCVCVRVLNGSALSLLVSSSPSSKGGYLRGQDGQPNVRRFAYLRLHGKRRIKWKCHPGAVDVVPAQQSTAHTRGRGLTHIHLSHIHALCTAVSPFGYSSPLIFVTHWKWETTVTSLTHDHCLLTLNNLQPLITIIFIWVFDVTCSSN